MMYQKTQEDRKIIQYVTRGYKDIECRKKQGDIKSCLKIEGKEKIFCENPNL